MSGAHDMQRLHGLDALRAAMMLLGLVLHSAVSYTAKPVGQAWRYHDPNTSGVFDWVVFIIHLFRMPTFFVMAGFFAAFLFYRQHVRGFLAHRARRLLLPLAAAWVLLFPPTIAGFVYAIAKGGSAGLDAALTYLGTTPYAAPTLIHLWFLYDLLIFCVAAAVVVPLVGRLPAAFRAHVVASFGRIAPTFAGCLAFGVLSGITMIPMHGHSLDTSAKLLQPARVLVAYAVFFSFGWLLFVRRDLVASFGRRPWLFLSAGAVMSVVFMGAVLNPPFSDLLTSHVATVAVAGVAMWLLIYGVTGLFVRHCEVPRPIQRYFSDASYWMYLIHLPVVIWLVGLLGPVAMPAIAKFAIVLGGVTLVTVTTYHFLVRSTVIGAFLNGRRFARGLPRVQHGSPLVAKKAVE